MAGFGAMHLFATTNAEQVLELGIAKAALTELEAEAPHR